MYNFLNEVREKEEEVSACQPASILSMCLTCFHAETLVKQSHVEEESLDKASELLMALLPCVFLS